MRKYLFRGKRKEGNEWLYGDLNQIEGKVYIFERGVAADLHSPDWFEVIPESVGQFTGQFGRVLGRENSPIFEGDIQRDEIAENWGDTRFYYVCRYLPEIASFVWMSYDDTLITWAKAKEEYPISLQHDEHYTICGNEFDDPKWWQKD